MSGWYRTTIQGERDPTRGALVFFEDVPLVLPDDKTAALALAFRRGESAQIFARSAEALDQITEMVVELAMELRFGRPALH